MFFLTKNISDTDITAECVVVIKTEISCSGFNIIECSVKEGSVLFNDALSTFYLRLYGVRHMVKDTRSRETCNYILVGKKSRLRGLRYRIEPSQ